MSIHTERDWRRDLLEMIYAITCRKLTVGFILLASITIGLVLANSAPPYYRASSTIVLLPREKPILDLSVQSSSVETSEDAAKRSSSATLTLPPNPDLYSTLIRSSEVTQRVAASLSADGDSSTGPAIIRAGVSVESTEEGVIKISMMHGDAEVAASVVNALVRECEQASKAIERQLILQQAGFLGRAIDSAETRLEETRSKLSDFSNRFGVSNPSDAAARSATLIRTLDDSEARIGRELNRLLVHRTELDPSAIALSEELRDVQARRAKVRADYCGALSESEYAALECEWNALSQDVMLRRDLLMSMRARHDVFTIRAEQPAGNIAVIRPAEPPSVPAGPSRRKYLVFSAFVGGLLSCLFCVIADQLGRMRRDRSTRALLASVSKSVVSFRTPRRLGSNPEVSL